MNIPIVELSVQYVGMYFYKQTIVFLIHLLVD
ncbi:Uncharacterised protein [Streptococcus pneumoniae]|nr:Uncharacterised protein [Streptococcus pneumoniae]